MAKNVMQMPPINIMPKAGDAARYGLNPDPLADRSGLRHLGILPTTTSLKVGQSIIGVGYETLDRDTFNPAPSGHVCKPAG